MKIVFEDNSYADGVIAEIDRACDAARLSVVQDPLRVWEYNTAKEQAQAYRDAGYAGPVPEFVLAWADAKHRQKWTGRQAAEDILATAAPWEAALAAIRRTRLKFKEDVRAMKGKGGIDAALTEFKNTLNTLLGG